MSLPFAPPFPAIPPVGRTASAHGCARETVKCGPWTERGRELLAWARRGEGAGDECVQNPSACAESSARPLGGLRRVAVGPRQEPAPLHLWTTSVGYRDRLVSRHTPAVWFAHALNRSLGEQVVLTQQSKALMFPRGGCHRGAGRRGLGRSCFSAWVGRTHGWFLCGLLPVACVQGVR